MITIKQAYGKARVETTHDFGFTPLVVCFDIGDEWYFGFCNTDKGPGFNPNYSVHKISGAVKFRNHKYIIPENSVKIPIEEVLK